MADPLSITTGCLGLITTVAKTTVSITNFIRGCRDARADLTAVSLELSELRIVLELLHEDNSAALIPDNLQRQILSIIANCTAVVDKINHLLEGYNVEVSKAIGGGALTSVKWVTFGKSEFAGLQMSLEAHRGSLELVLELVSISLSKSTKEDTSAIREDVVDIKQDMSQILEELGRLRAIVSGGGMSAAVPGQNHVLEKWLDSLSSYAETVCNDADWGSDGASLHATSARPSLEIPVTDQSHKLNDLPLLPQPLPRAPEPAETASFVNATPQKTTARHLSSAPLIESSDAKPSPLEKGKSRVNGDVCDDTMLVALSSDVDLTGLSFSQMWVQEGRSQETEKVVASFGPATKQRLSNKDGPQTSSAAARPAAYEDPSSATSGSAPDDEPMAKEPAWGPKCQQISSVTRPREDPAFNAPPPPPPLTYVEAEDDKEDSEAQSSTNPITVWDELKEIISRPRNISPLADAKVRAVFVGHGCSGKTTLLNTLSDVNSATDWISKSWDMLFHSWEIYTPLAEVDRSVVQFEFFDTRGQEDYDRCRPLYYLGVDVYIITFSVGSPDGFDEVWKKWAPEMRHFAKGAPCLLIGLQTELRGDAKLIEQLKGTDQKPVTAEEGLAMSRRINAARYLECSFKTREGAFGVFDAIASVALQHRKSQRKSLIWSLIGKAFNKKKN